MFTKMIKLLTEDLQKEMLENEKLSKRKASSKETRCGNL